MSKEDLRKPYIEEGRMMAHIALVGEVGCQKRISENRTQRKVEWWISRN